MRTTKYCQNIGPKHIRNVDSPSKHYCTECYNSTKARLEKINQQGGPVAGLRMARVMADGSFGYERSRNDKERNLRAFFYYVMPHIPDAKVDVLVKDMAKTNSSDYCTNDGIKRVKHY